MLFDRLGNAPNSGTKRLPCRYPLENCVGCVMQTFACPAWQTVIPSCHAAVSDFLAEAPVLAQKQEAAEFEKTKAVKAKALELSTLQVQQLEAVKQSILKERY